jgi:hypothetical protein
VPGVGSQGHLSPKKWPLQGTFAGDLLLARSQGLGNCEAATSLTAHQLEPLWDPKDNV